MIDYSTTITVCNLERKRTNAMFATLKNIGCLAVIIIIGIFVFGVYKAADAFSVYKAADDAAPSGRVNTSPDVSDRSEPLPEIVSLMFHESCRNYMNDPDSYKPGNTRIGNHLEGYAYVHEFRGRNAARGMIKDICGLLYSTNTHSWTFFDKYQLPELLKDVTVNGKRITDESGRSAAPRTDTQKQTAKPTTANETTVKISKCAKCKGKGVVAVQTKCSKCGGAGRIYTNGKWTPCPKKVTTGERKCRDCDGAGTIEIRE